MAVLGDQRGEDIVTRVKRHLRDKPIKLAKVLLFLVRNEHRTQCIEVLGSFLNDDTTFGNLVMLLAKDIDYLEQHPDYPIVEIWKIARPTNANRNEKAQRFDFQLFLAKKERFELIVICMFLTILTRLNVLTPEILSYLVPALFNINLPVNLPFTDIIKMSQELSGDRYEITAGFGYFVYDAWQNKNRWHSSEISGLRCIKKTIDNFVEWGAGTTGICGGEYFGSAIANAKIVPFAGGVGAGLASTVLGGTLCDRFTQQFFNLPKDETLEKVCHHLEIPWRASNNEINLRYIVWAHQSCGSPESWRRFKIHPIQRLIIS